MKKSKFLCLVLACLLMVSLVRTPVQAVDEDGHEAFSCFTYDDQGRMLDGYWSEEDETWYLFLTSTQSLSDTSVYYTGPVLEASAGTLIPECSVLTGAFGQSGDTVELIGPNNTIHKVVAMQSDLPSVYIDLEGTTLAEIHADKDEKHKGNSIYIMDPAGEHDLTVEDTVEIKGRGNSTWREYEKKAYQIKFDDKTSVMGMGKAKKWILLANASDDSMMRSQLVYTMAENLGMDFVTSFAYVDLWIEGEYRGTFLLGEKVELGSSRLDLQNDTGALFEHDEDFYLDEDYWFVNEMLNRHFTMKEIVEEEEDIIQTAMTDFNADLTAFVKYLYETPADQITLASLSAMIDVDDFAKYYLINEYALNRESFSTSFYWYQDGADDVIHLGPIWDFDTCMGNDGEPYTASYGDTHMIFHYLLAVPEFRARTQELLQQYREDLTGMTAEVETLKEHIAASAAMNYTRWDVLGKPNPKGGADFHPTFDEAAAALQNWLAGREEAFRIVETATVTSVVSQDCYEMDITFRDSGEYDKVIFAVWSQEGGIDDMAWYTATQDSQGTWRYTVDLGNHDTAGIYYINAYTNEQQTLLASGRNYVETARAARYPMAMTIAEDMLTVQMEDKTGELTNVRFGVWGLANQAQSLTWLTAEKDETDKWSVTVPVCRFNLTGEDILVAHAYTDERFLNEARLFLAEPVGHTYPEGETVCSLCGNKFSEDAEIATVPMYRLYNPNSGEHFYTGSEEERENLVAAGWIYEGIAWHAPVAEGIPVHRLFNPNSSDHHYTTSTEEMDNLVEAGWQYEGVAWNSAYSGSAQFRLYNPNADLGSHHYTSSTEERDHLVSLGWIWEGIGWYGIITREPV